MSPIWKRQRVSARTRFLSTGGVWLFTFCAYYIKFPGPARTLLEAVCASVISQRTAPYLR